LQQGVKLYWSMAKGKQCLLGFEIKRTTFTLQNVVQNYVERRISEVDQAKQRWVLQDVVSSDYPPISIFGLQTTQQTNPNMEST